MGKSQENRSIGWHPFCGPGMNRSPCGMGWDSTGFVAFSVPVSRVPTTMSCFERIFENFWGRNIKTTSKTMIFWLVIRILGSTPHFCWLNTTCFLKPRVRMMLKKPQGQFVGQILIFAGRSSPNSLLVEAHPTWCLQLWVGFITRKPVSGRWNIAKIADQWEVDSLDSWENHRTVRLCSSSTALFDEMKSHWIRQCEAHQL